MPDMDKWPTGRLLSTAARLVEHAWNERLASIGITHAGIIALDVLASQGPMTQAQLASIVRVQAQTMGKTLSRLESHGHVERVRNVKDRRSHLVTLSDAGRVVIGRAHGMENGLLDRNGLDPDALRNSLKRVIQSLGEQVPVEVSEPLGTVSDPELPIEETLRVTERSAS
jgi:DNA-binding MarR family transcriptional regulator